jgi:hypothetical protein
MVLSYVYFKPDPRLLALSLEVFTLLALSFQGRFGGLAAFQFTAYFNPL